MYEYIYKKQMIVEFDKSYQIESFDILLKIIKKSYESSTSIAERLRYLNFIFNNKPIIFQQKEYIFTHEVRTINLHPDIIRVRLIYQFYLNGYSLDLNKFQINSDLPNAIMNELLFRRGEIFDVKNLALRVCKFVYKYPSVNMSRLLDSFVCEFTIEEVSTVIHNLELSNVLGLKNDCLYFIGRNPAKYNLKRFYWSNQWLF